MIRMDDVIAGKVKLYIKSLHVGPSGSGKTHLAATYPKCYFLMTEPGGEDTFISNPALRKNVVGFDKFIPESPQDTKNVFEQLEKAVIEAKELFTKGEIETLVLDNITYLAANRKTYIWEYQKELTRTGELNPLVMYGKLSTWLYEFTLYKLISFPGNVVINCHEMVENDDTLDKKPDKTTPILPNIIGGFRDKIEGMVSYVFYLTKLEDGKGGYNYWVRTNKGNQRNAKSRVMLPTKIEDVSYDKIMKVLLDSLKNSKKEVV